MPATGRRGGRRRGVRARSSSTGLLGVVGLALIAGTPQLAPAVSAEVGAAVAPVVQPEAYVVPMQAEPAAAVSGLATPAAAGPATAVVAGAAVLAVRPALAAIPAVAPKAVAPKAVAPKVVAPNAVAPKAVAPKVVAPTAAKPAAVRAVSPIAAAAARASRKPSKANSQAYARLAVKAHGWGNADYQCLVKLWTKESQWNHKARNRSSGAYGIPQSLPGSKMASAGRNWRTDPPTQIRWGLSYITSRYGTPCGAWRHSQARNWY